MIMGVIVAGSIYGASLGRPEMTGLFAFVGCATGCMLFGQILIITGIMTVSSGSNELSPQYLDALIASRQQKEEWEAKGRHAEASYNYRNYHYRSIIAKVNKSGVTVTSVQDAIKTYSSLFNVGEKAAKPFFQNQFVMTSLGLNINNSTQTSQVGSNRNNKTKKFDENFWDNVSQGVAKNEAKSDQICAASDCSEPVSAFDFRCFQCRGRFCENCESGKSIMCKSCS